MMSPPHPGMSIGYDCLEPMGLSITGAARRLRVSRKQPSALVNGRPGMSPEIAVRLVEAFGVGASTRRQMQAAYDLAQVLSKTGGIHFERIVAGTSG